MQLNVILGKVKIKASAGERCPHGQAMWGGYSILQGLLGSYSSHVCASSSVHLPELVISKFVAPSPFRPLVSIVQRLNVISILSNNYIKHEEEFFIRYPNTER